MCLDLESMKMLKIVVNVGINEIANIFTACSFCRKILSPTSACTNCRLEIQYTEYESCVSFPILVC